MAPATSSSSALVDDNVPVEEIVFSCSICQATVSEVYATVESNHGFHSGSGDEDGLVTKMWIASCSHVTCGKHLENGAAPFHPQGEPPRAPCPKCLHDTQDDSLKELYGIRGLVAGKVDSMIPAEWLQCPAVNLDSSMPGMEAVRFQYMALCHYSRQVRRHWKTAQHHQSTIEAAYSRERKQRRQIQSEVLELKNKVEKLDIAEAKLQKWDNRTPYINYYLGVFPRMMEDIADQDEVLRCHGYDIPERKYFYEPGDTSHEQENREPDDVSKPRIRASATGAYEDQSSSSARKRKREEYPEDGFDMDVRQRAEFQASSRDMMPPPLPKAKPVQRIMPPSSQSLKSQAHFTVPGASHPIQVYEENEWRQTRPKRNIFKPPESRQSALQTHPSSQMRQNLPFRPSQSRAVNPRSSFESQEVAQSTRHNVETFAQLSLRSSNQQDGQLDQCDSGRDDTHGGYHRHNPRIDNSGPSNPFTAQQQASQARLPLQELSGSYQTSLGRPVHTPSPQKITQRPGASVISPFFNRDTNAGRPPSMFQRPPSRGHTHLEPQHTSLIRNVPDGMSLAPPQSRYFDRQDERQSATRSSFAAGSRAVDQHQQPYHRPQYSPDTRTQLQQPFAVPRTPRNSQGLLQRPDRQHNAYNAPPRTQSKNTSRSRVSLPPTTGFTMASQDKALSQIPGVRGMTSQRGLPSYPRTNQGYDQSRNLFSSAGGRRSVRR